MIKFSEQEGLDEIGMKRTNIMTILVHKKSNRLIFIHVRKGNRNNPEEKMLYVDPRRSKLQIDRTGRCFVYQGTEEWISKYL